MTPLGVALLLTIAFRLPPLVNANALNSDAAIVGLQAQHMLEGEFSFHLWGAPYQAALDPLLSALLFLVGGASATLLLLVPLLGMLLMVALAYAIVSRHTEPAAAFLAVLPLVFATQAVNSPMTYVLRQSLACWAVLAVWCFEVASDRKRPEWLFALGGALVGLGFLLDTFFLVLLPPLALFGALRASESPVRWRSFLAVGVSLTLTLAASIHWKKLPANDAVSGDSVRYTSELLWRECLPFALAVRVWLPGSVEWLAPPFVQALQFAAACLFVGALASGVVLGRGTRAYALGVMGVLGGLTALAAFVYSTAPFDMWSARYLAPMLWLSPFALTPLLSRLGWRRSAVLLGPWFCSALVAGWVSYGPFVQGPLIVRTEHGVAASELELGRVLRERGVHHARAQYWQAYRLSLLWREDPLVVPLEADLDRVPAARKQVDEAPSVAAIFHPEETRASADEYEQALVAVDQSFERVQVGDWVVFIIDRDRCEAPGSSLLRWGIP